MQSIILAMNISSADKINSSISQLLVSALANGKISDIVVYLPQLEDKSFSTLCYLASGIEESGYLGNTHFFIPDEDKEEISLDALNQFRKCFPRVVVSSKDSYKQVGDINFRYFDSKSFYSDELDDYFNELYSVLKRVDSDLCIVTDSDEDAVVMNKLSSRISVLNSDDVKAFRSRTRSNSISLSYDYVEKLSLEYKIPLDIKKENLYKKKEITVPDDNEKVIKRVLEPVAKKKGKI